MFCSSALCHFSKKDPFLDCLVIVLKTENKFDIMFCVSWPDYDDVTHPSLLCSDNDGKLPRVKRRRATKYRSLKGLLGTPFSVNFA